MRDRSRIVGLRSWEGAYQGEVYGIASHVARFALRAAAAALRWRRMLSVVIPVRNEALGLRRLHDELHWTLAYFPGAVEFVYVDDGSSDGSWEALAALAARDARVVVVRLRGHFGKATAYAAGFRTARGELLATVDGDLQDDPAELPKLLAELERGYDLVTGWKRERQDPAVKVWSSRLFNALLARVSGVRLHDQNCGMRVLTREVAAALLLRGDLYRMMPALAAMQGFRVAEVPVRHRARVFGESQYGRTGLRRTFRGIFDCMTVAFLFRYRQRPFHFFGAVGGALFGVGVIVNAYLTILWLWGARIGGRPLLTLGVLLMVVGVQLLATGFLADLVLLGRERSEDLPIREVRRQSV